MAKSTRKTRRERRRSRRSNGPDRGGVSWPTLGLGAAALALTGIYQAGRREQRRRGGEEASDLGSDPATGSLLKQDAALPTESPAGRRTLAGPGGRLSLIAREAVRETGGALPAVLFVHGLGGAARQWIHQIDSLTGIAPLCALDLRGHGESEGAADGDYSIEALADDVLAAADALSLERFVVAAHSLGAAVGVALADRSPGRVAGLFLVDPGLDQTRLPRAQVDSLLDAVKKDPHGELSLQYRTALTGAGPAVVERVLADLAAADEAALSGALASAAEMPLAARLADYRGPALSLASPFNQLPASLHRLLPDLAVQPLPGSSHWPMLDRPREVGAALERFLGHLAPSS